MILHRYIIKLTASVFFLFTLMLPIAIQASLFFETHKHVVCEEQTVHIHEESQDCPLCEFRLVSFKYDLTNHEEIFKTSNFEKAEPQYASLLYNSSTNSNTRLRGPPHIHI